MTLPVVNQPLSPSSALNNPCVQAGGDEIIAVGNSSETMLTTNVDSASHEQKCKCCNPCCGIFCFLKDAICLYKECSNDVDLIKSHCSK